MENFKEVQWFRQSKLWLTGLALPPIILVGGLISTYMNEDKIAETPLLIMSGVIILLSAYILVSGRLETTVNESGVSYRMTPFHWRWHQLKWNEIASAYIRMYHPIGEYGGRGIRPFWIRSKAFRVDGVKGLQLELTNGKKVLLGTLKEQELREFLGI